MSHFPHLQSRGIKWPNIIGLCLKIKRENPIKVIATVFTMKKIVNEF
jgi:hypothetical protein